MMIREMFPWILVCQLYCQSVSDGGSAQTSRYLDEARSGPRKKSKEADRASRIEKRHGCYGFAAS
jgi:hypothetical protein